MATIENATMSAQSSGKPGRQKGIARGLTLLTLRAGQEYRLGAKTDRGILDVPQAAQLLNLDAPATMDDLLQQEEGPALNALMEAALKSNLPAKAFVREQDVQFGPVVTRPEKIICVGLNYRHHALEIGIPVPKEPVLFSKFNVALNSHNGFIKLPTEAAKKFDYEAELVIIMGKEARNVAEANALNYVAGYATGNDFSARELQLEKGGQWLLGKTPDGFAPLGPYMVTADQIDPDNLKIECHVNGEIRQSSSTSDLIFNNSKIVSYISQFITLKPGDVIFTGTPEGVIQGKPKDQQIWLKPGDKVACSVEKLGELRFELTK